VLRRCLMGRIADRDSRSPSVDGRSRQDLTQAHDMCRRDLMNGAPPGSRYAVAARRVYPKRVVDLEQAHLRSSGVSGQRFAYPVSELWRTWICLARVDGLTVRKQALAEPHFPVWRREVGLWRRSPGCVAFAGSTPTRRRSCVHRDA